MNIFRNFPVIKSCVAITIIVAAVLGQWRTLEPGLELAAFPSPRYPKADSAVVTILRVDTKRYELALFNASHPAQGEMLTARGWGRKEGLAAAINAAMYQADYRTSVSHMKTSTHTNNSRVSKDKTILVFEPLKKGIPPARIVDTQCDDYAQIAPLYGSAVQSIRMISCAGANVWQQSERRWSVAAVGTDSAGRVLLIHCSAPHSVHDFINALRELPISIDRAMYMEGSSPAQMYVGAAGDTVELIGDFSAGGRPVSAPALPNVLGIRKLGNSK
jgi:uncharacterized protein YigE (DUF2233 family)